MQLKTQKVHGQEDIKISHTSQLCFSYVFKHWTLDSYNSLFCLVFILKTVWNYSTVLKNRSHSICHSTKKDCFFDTLTSLLSKKSYQWSTLSGILKAQNCSCIFPARWPGTGNNHQIYFPKGFSSRWGFYEPLRKWTDNFFGNSTVN